MSTPFDFDEWLAEWLTVSGDEPSPSALVAAFGLVERVRHRGGFSLSEHKRPTTDGLLDHNQWCELACERFGLQVSHVRAEVAALGRRSNGIAKWGQPLLDVIRSLEPQLPDDSANSPLHLQVHVKLAEAVSALTMREPIRAFRRGIKLERAISELLEEAVRRRCADDVAQYLVAAKLSMRLNLSLDRFAPTNTPNRLRRDQTDRRGDFDLGQCVYEVAAGTPDEEHLRQASRVCHAVDFWLLVREAHLDDWRRRLSEHGLVPGEHLHLCSIESFLAPNITEMGLVAEVDLDQMIQSLLTRYNALAARSVAKIEREPWSSTS